MPRPRRGTPGSRLAWAIGIAALVASDAPGAARAAAKRGPPPVTVAYSTDDALCRPLAGALSAYERTHRNGVDWINDAPEVFARVGVRQPPAVVDKTHQVVGPDVASLINTQIFYRLDITGSGAPRLVLLRDWMAWRYSALGDYTTTIWLLKPGSDYRARTDRRDTEDPDPKTVDLKLDFGGPGGDYRAPPWPYHPVAARQAPSRAFNDLREVISHGPQRLFVSGRRAYVMAGGKYDALWVVYGVRPDLSIEEVCNFRRAGRIVGIDWSVPGYREAIEDELTDEERAAFWRRWGPPPSKAQRSLAAKP